MVKTLKMILSGKNLNRVFCHQRRMIFIPILFSDKVALSLASGLLAALFSYYINSKALKNFGEEAIIYWAPVFEETLKTGFALALGGGAILSHMTFGVVEAIYDVWENRGIVAYWAGFTSLASHSAFGAITQYFIHYLGNRLFGLSIAIVVHIAWNYMVVNLKKQR